MGFPRKFPVCFFAQKKVRKLINIRLVLNLFAQDTYVLGEFPTLTSFQCLTNDVVAIWRRRDGSARDLWYLKHLM